MNGITYDTTMRKRYRVVIDSNVYIAALRSRRGPSFRLLSLIGRDLFDISLSVPLVLEYEAVARRDRWKGKPAWGGISDIIDYMCQVGRRHKIHYLWRPREKDPKDDMVLEVAVAGHCEVIVTYNKRDFREAAKHGLQLMTPKEFLMKLGDTP
ncbi:MAG TPA: putative toxin-antitoxin system toxin component, PIN family [Kiritimatiellia bacterium]|nr:putative toxin-antitoxin system toxin component, PIN family [Kiritimatiellia bacterium]